MNAAPAPNAACLRDSDAVHCDCINVAPSLDDFTHGVQASQMGTRVQHCGRACSTAQKLKACAASRQQLGQYTDVMYTHHNHCSPDARPMLSTLSLGLAPAASSCRTMAGLP